jgi:hypothetical protein
VGQESSLSGPSCLIKSTGSADAVYDSMQALVVRSNGWKFEVKSIDLEDIDSQPGRIPGNAWKESMAIFGEADGTLVLPAVSLTSDTLLSVKNYAVPSAAMSEMELSSRDIRVIGAEFSSPRLHNCRAAEFGDDADAHLCRMTASFSSGIDTLVIRKFELDSPGETHYTCNTKNILRLKTN